MLSSIYIVCGYEFVTHTWNAYAYRLGASCIIPKLAIYTHSIYRCICLYTFIHTPRQNDARLSIHTLFGKTYRQTEKQTDFENQHFQYHRRWCALHNSVFLLDSFVLFLITLTDCICTRLFCLAWSNAHCFMLPHWISTRLLSTMYISDNKFVNVLGHDKFEVTYVHSW